MFYKHICVLLSVSLFCSHMLIPLVEAGHHGHNNEEGLAVLLAAGLIAKILGKKKHEVHHVHIPVPVEHHEPHGHHGHHGGAASTRIIVHHPGPFHNIHGGMMPAPSMVQRYVYHGGNRGYLPPPY